MTPTGNLSDNGEHTPVYQTASGYEETSISETQKFSQEPNSVISVSSQASEVKVNVNWEQLRNYEFKKEVNRSLRSK